MNYILPGFSPKFSFVCWLDEQTFSSQEYHNLFSFCRHSRSQSCPFCRDSLKRVKSGDLWIYTSPSDIVDLTAIARESIRRLIIYIKKLPIVAELTIVPYNSQYWLGFLIWSPILCKYTGLSFRILFVLFGYIRTYIVVGHSQQFLDDVQSHLIMTIESRKYKAFFFSLLFFVK